MTNYTLRKGNPATTRTDAVVVAIGRNDKGDAAIAPGGEGVADAYGRGFRALLAANECTGAEGQVLRLPTAGVLRAGHLVLVGIGNLAAITPLAIQRAAGAASREVGSASSVAIALPTASPEHLTAAISGFVSGGYRMAKVGKPSPAGLADVIVLSDGARRNEMITAFERALVLEGGTRQARDWVNTPPNLLTPAAFADAGATYLTEAGITTEILDPTDLRAEGCGGILGVGAAAANEPRLLHATWKHRDARVRIALVGKGITFDSGGLTIKPGSSMPTMKYDMAGAAAVIAATRAVADLDLKVDLHMYVPMAENAVSGTSMRPGDVITMRNGRTVEVTNTDAEGRLILADALALAAEQEPAFILEASTLTGACLTALGDRVAGVFGEDTAVRRVEAAAQSAREPVWHLPIPEDAISTVTATSPIADLLQHDWGRWGSASYAAAFLAQFVDGIDFAHLDIAGPAWNARGPWADLPAGATGFGVRTLVETIAMAADTL